MHKCVGTNSIVAVIRRACRQLVDRSQNEDDDSEWYMRSVRAHTELLGELGEIKKQPRLRETLELLE